jgi:hypothetical protein
MRWFGGDAHPADIAAAQGIPFDRLSYPIVDP